MLAYVYGVVPISLCRSGGCGVSAGNGKGVRIEFDDENDNMGSGAAATGERHRSGPDDFQSNPLQSRELKGCRFLPETRPLLQRPGSTTPASATGRASEASRA